METIFGTIYHMDGKPNEYSELFRKLLFQCRDVLQADLKSLEATAELERKVLERTGAGGAAQSSDRARARHAGNSPLGELTASIAHEVKPAARRHLRPTPPACRRFLDREKPDLDEARDILRGYHHGQQSSA